MAVALLLLNVTIGSFIPTRVAAPIHVSQSQQSYVSTDSNYIYIGNGYEQFTLTKSTGGIYALVDKRTGTDFVQNKSANAVLFNFLTDYDGYFNFNFLVNSPTANSFTFSTTTFSGGAEVEMQWTGFNEGPGFDIKAYANVTLYDNSSLSYWHIRFENHSPQAIIWVTFPIIGLGQLSSNAHNDYFAHPQFSGVLYRDPLHNILSGGVGWMQLYPGGYENMQFDSYYSTETGAGLYFAAYDSGGYAKFLNLAKPGGNLMLSQVFIPSFVDGTDLEMPYNVVLGVFQGDWYSAALIYRQWALKQWWTAQGPLRTRSDVPNWLRNTYVTADVFTRYWTRTTHLWNGPFSNVPWVAKSMKDTYGSSPLLFWRGWEHEGWYVGGPLDMFPPSEGWSNFDAAVQNTHLNGGRIFVIEDSSQFTINATGWNTAKDHAAEDQFGNFYTYTAYPLDNSGKAVKEVFAAIDPDSYWKSTLGNMAVALAQHGVDMLHLDGSPITFLDFSNDHSNPIGGGNWWMNGYKDVFSTARTEARQVNPDFAFGSEWCAEVYIPYIDACNDETSTGLNPMNINGGGVVDPSLVSYIPLWQSVYHDYTLSYATIALMTGIDRQFYQRGLGLDAVFGESPMVDMDPQGTGPPYQMNLYDAALLKYSVDTVTLRSTYSSYLVLGEMLGPLNIVSPTFLIPATTNPIPYSEVYVPAFQSQSVIGSSWQAADGSVGILITNISSTAVMTTLNLTSIPNAPLGSLTISLKPLQVTFMLVNLVGKQYLPLTKGWNLISLPVVPANPSITALLGSQIAVHDVDVAWGYTGSPRAWHSFTPGKGGPLTTMTDGYGYWIYMTQADTLFVDGSVIPPAGNPPTYSLVQGWNLVGFKPQPTIQNETVSAYLTSISGSYDMNNVWLYDNISRNWIRADSSYLLQPGQAMWILMTSPATLRP